MSAKRPRVVLLFGGRSAEHEVSCASAASVMRAIDQERYEVLAVGIDRAGRWHLLASPPALEPGTGTLPSVDPAEGTVVTLAEGEATGALVGAAGAREPIDVVFPMLHGPFGEDGTMQGLLELAGVPYVGAGVLASAIGMDKSVQKALFRTAGLPVVRHETVLEPEWRDDPESVEAGSEALGFPQFVKPANLGSSIGISKVKGPGDLEPALEEAFRHGRKALIEEAVDPGREIECAVLGNVDPVASLPGEILPAGEFYDYRSKYVDEGTRLEVPADLPPAIVEEIQGLAVAAFHAIACAGMARVDFFLRPQNEVIVNEINTIPGFTEVSMYPRMWEASGLPYPQLIDRLIELALERHGANAGQTGQPTDSDGPA